MFKSVVNEDYDQINKENGEIGLYSVRSKLQRLGKLYSGELCCVVHSHKLVQTDFFTLLYFDRYTCILYRVSHMERISTITVHDSIHI